MQLLTTLILIATPALALPNGASGNHYRMVGSGPASVAARPLSTSYQSHLAGGSGAVIGIAASASASTVSGPLSARLPTERIFRDNFGD